MKRAMSSLLAYLRSLPAMDSPAKKLWVDFMNLEHEDDEQPAAANGDLSRGGPSSRLGPPHLSRDLRLSKSFRKDASNVMRDVHCKRQAVLVTLFPCRVTAPSSASNASTRPSGRIRSYLSPAAYISSDEVAKGQTP